jgi:glycosyltransferase involved in cell wall biosynthesis
LGATIPPAFNVVSYGGIVFRSLRAVKRLIRFILRITIGRNPKNMERFDRAAGVLRQRIAPTGGEEAVQRREKADYSKLPFGANLIGYFQGEYGLASGARATLLALETTDCPLAVQNMLTKGYADSDRSVTSFSKDTPYRFNILIFNPEKMGDLREQHPETYALARYNIGVWFWESNILPDLWKQSLEQYEEVWVHTEFERRPISEHTSKPVIRIPYGMKVDEALIVPGREQFSLPEDQYVFLMSFDFSSGFDRKNPLAAVEAFRKAFGQSRDAGFVIKSMHGDFPDNKDKMAALQAACEGLNIRIIDDVFDKGQLYSLIKACDCVVSLHRAEGLGLSLAEPMCLGKPVIGTNYSGNTDFMTAETSFLVRYELKERIENSWPYPEGTIWAEADVDHAAELMRYVFENHEAAEEVGRRAALHMRENFSPEVSGQAMLVRLREISDRIGGA